MAKADLEAVLKEILTEKYVSSDPNVAIAYVRDTGIFEGFPPEEVVRPGSAEEVSEILKVANSERKPVVIRGGGSTYTGSCVPLREGTILMDLTRLDDVVEIDEGARSITVQAGINWGKMMTILRQRGYTTGMTGPGSGWTATVGGSASVASTGGGRAKFGGICDQILGLQVVLPTGEIIRTGSRVNPYAKAFCRYGLGPDMTGLFLGDHGIFGVKTEVTMRLHPLAKSAVHFEYAFRSEEKAIEAFAEIGKVNELATSINIYDADYVSFSAKRPGYAYLSGFEGEVLGTITAQSEKLALAQKEIFDEIAKRHGGEELEPKRAKHAYENTFYPYNTYFWMRRDSGIYLCLANQNSADSLLRVIRGYREFLKAHKDVVDKYFEYQGITVQTYMRHITMSARRYLPWKFDMDPEARRIAMDFWTKEIDFFIRNGAVHYWIGKIVGDRLYILVSKEYHEFLKRVKRALDPNGILNPGLFLL
jgi:FAD/FMN-containing dehydrogenase